MIKADFTYLELNHFVGNRLHKCGVRSSITRSVVQKQSSSLEKPRWSTIIQLLGWFIKIIPYRLGNAHIPNVLGIGPTFKAYEREFHSQRTNLPVNFSLCLSTDTTSLFYKIIIIIYNIFVRIHATAHVYVIVRPNIVIRSNVSIVLLQ